MSWRFAIINNRLAEIFFDGKNPNFAKIFGHAYVNREEYTTKKEQKWITEDTKKLKFSYRQGIYKSTLSKYTAKRQQKRHGRQKTGPITPTPPSSTPPQ